MATATLDLDALKQQIGRTQTAEDVLHAGPANLLRLSLGRSEGELRDRDPLPPAWLAGYFLPRFATAELRPGGSPRDTGLIPPEALPRPGFARGRVRVPQTPATREPVRRRTAR